MYTGPNIADDGLVLSLDVANIKSYVSGSTTWTDLSRRGNNGTLVNGPIFDSANLGSIVFDGVDDRINLPDIGITELSAFSISCWVRTSTGTSNYPIVYTEGTPSSWPNNLFILYYGDITGANGGVRVWFNGASQITYNTSVVDNKWRHLVYNQTNNSARSIYLNGIQVGTNTTTITHVVTNSYVGAGSNNGSFLQFYKGDISNMQLYNRALTPVEILQNYEGLKSRYGL